MCLKFNVHAPVRWQATRDVDRDDKIRKENKKGLAAIDG